VAFTDAAEPDMVSPSGGREVFTSPEQGGFVQHEMRYVLAQAGPIAVTFLDDETAFVHSWLDRSVSRLPYEEVVDQIDGRRQDEFSFLTLATEPGRRLAESALAPEVEEGRRLFYSAVDPRMAGDGAGVSCATCHFDGRNDGLTWKLDGELRQTLSLAGPVNETAPVTWSNGVASVADEAMLTSSLRMGGNGLEESDAALIEAYVSWSRLPDTELAGSTDPLVKLGEEVFARPEVGCASCHSGEHFTDNRDHALYSAVPTQTPTLRGISATAPYLHDGSAETLRDLLERVRDGSMGDTSSLSERELDGLEAYLRSL
jgi:cytochrome c peroxidase